MAKPSVLPVWATTAGPTDLIVPPGAKQLTGWAIVGGIPEKPAYQYFNWWQNTVYNYTHTFDHHLFQQTTLRAGANVYTDTDDAAKAIGSVTGYTNVVTTRGAAAGDTVWAVYTNVAQAQTANAALNTTSQVAALTLTAAGTFTAAAALVSKVIQIQDAGTPAAGAITYVLATGTFAFGTSSGIKSSITDAGAFTGVTGSFPTSVTSKIFQLSDAGTPAAGAITYVSGTGTFAFGTSSGIKSSITDAGAASFLTSVTSPLHTYAGATTFSATGASGALTLAAGTTLAVNVGTNSASVSALSATALGVLSFGPQATANTTNDKVHKINGMLAVATPSSPAADQAGAFLIGSNCKLGSWGNRFNADATTGSSGAGIFFDTRTGSSKVVLSFLANKWNDTAATDATTVGSYTDSAVWTLGTSTAPQRVVLASDATWTTSGWYRGIELRSDSVIKWAKISSYAMGIGASGDVLYFLSSTVDVATGAAATSVGSITGAGVVTFPTNTTHIFGNTTTAAATQVALRCNAATGAQVTYQIGAATIWQVGIDNSGPGGSNGYWWYTTAYLGGISAGGNWTLGTATTNTHELKGYTSHNAGTAGASDTNYPNFAVKKLITTMGAAVSNITKAHGLNQSKIKQIVGKFTQAAGTSTSIPGQASGTYAVSVQWDSTNVIIYGWNVQTGASAAPGSEITIDLYVFHESD